MTYPRYILHRIAKAFGIDRKGQRNSHITSETHLLRQAEAELGKRIWREVESVEALNSAYWSLRKLHIKHQELSQGIEQGREQLQHIQSGRAGLLKDSGGEANPELVRRHDDMVSNIGEWTRERERIGEDIKRSVELQKAAQTQLEVLELERETDPGKLAEVKGRVMQSVDRIRELEQRQKQLTERIKQGDLDIEGVNRELAAQTDLKKENAAEASMDINQINKEVARLMNERSALEKEMHQLQKDIGRHVSRNSLQDPACRKAASSARGLVEVMAALRRSIDYNRRLNGSRSR